VYQAFSNSWANYIEEFYKNLKHMVPPIQNFEFLGGEPLLIKENLEFMQYLIDAGLSEDCIFEFTTNGTQYSEIFDHADRFKRLTVTLSIDNLGEKFELERSGAQWSTVESNIEKFVNRKNSCSSLEVGVSITVNIQNIYYLPELITWLKHKGVTHYYYNWLSRPDWLNLDSLTITAKNMVIEKLSSTKFTGEDQHKLNAVISKVSKSSTSDGRKFCEEMKKLDLIRSQTFNLTHKEIAEAMGYTL
jgi:sulfatase maturation enzyme AslB (radical SAM superfamily)